MGKVRKSDLDGDGTETVLTVRSILSTESAPTSGYTRGMKTAVSVPDDLFAQVDRLARRSSRSRSEVYSAALREYVARHAPDEVTADLNAVVERLGEPDPGLFATAAARGTFASTEW